MPPLDKQTFDVWREQDDRFKDEIRTHIRTQNSINLDYEGRIAVVEVVQKQVGTKLDRRTTWLSAIVAAVVGALAAACAAVIGR